MQDLTIDYHRNIDVWPEKISLKEALLAIDLPSARPAYVAIHLNREQTARVRKHVEAISGERPNIVFRKCVGVLASPGIGYRFETYLDERGCILFRIKL